VDGYGYIVTEWCNDDIIFTRHKAEILEWGQAAVLKMCVKRTHKADGVHVELWNSGECRLKSSRKNSLEF
jgi:hypothetical protein